MIVLLVAMVAIAGALLLACLLAAYYLAEALTRTKRGRVEGNPADLLLRHDEVEFLAADGVSTRGWYLASPALGPPSCWSTTLAARAPILGMGYSNCSGTTCAGA